MLTWNKAPLFLPDNIVCSVISYPVSSVYYGRPTSVGVVARGARDYAPRHVA